MRLWKTTDDQYIARLRRYHRNRRKIGLLLFVIGILFCCSFIVTIYSLANGILNTMNAPDIDGNVSFEYMAENGRLNLKIGLYIGSFFTIGACSAFGLAMHGLEMLTKTDRKAILLLKYVDHYHNLPNQTTDRPPKDLPSSSR
jgi:hypothetical protein